MPVRHPDLSLADAFGLYHRRFVRQAIGMFGAAEADDAVSRMWLSAVLSWDQWRGRGTRRSWLASILRYEWYAWLHGAARRNALRPLARADGVPSPGDFARNAECRDFCGKVLRAMNPLQRSRLAEWVSGGKTGKDGAHHAVLHARAEAGLLARRPYKTVRAMAKEQKNA